MRAHADPCSGLCLHLTEKPHLQAMRLWSDWNVDIAEWSSRHQDGVTFDYLQIRTEDLVDPQTKYVPLRLCRGGRSLAVCRA